MKKTICLRKNVASFCAAKNNPDEVETGLGLDALFAFVDTGEKAGGA